jgi:hypothetical protein
MPVFLFVLPGILLALSGSFNKKGLSEIVVRCIGFSLSFFIVFPWMIKPLGISLLGSAYAVFILSVLIAAFRYKDIAKIFLNVDKSEAAILLLLLLVTLLRLMPVLLQQAPAGADMSMHSYIARLIFDNDKIPKTYEPLLHVSNFGAYPSGFPALVALVSLLGRIPVFKAALFLSCVSHALITFGLYVFLLNFFDKKTAILSSVLASFLTRSPQWVIRWGGTPTVLALFFLILAFALIIEAKQEKKQINVIFASLALAAAYLTHPIIFLAGGIMIATYYLTFMKERNYGLTTALQLGVYLLIFLSPYLMSTKLAITRSAIDYARSWQDFDIRSVLYDLIAGAPFIIMSLYGFFASWKERSKEYFAFALVALIICLLIINYRFWLIPFSYLFYPGRIALLMIIPLSFFVAPLVKANAFRSGVLSIALTAIGISFYSGFYLYNSVSMCSVTQADISAFKWIDNTISKNSVFANNYGDAGLWIPAIIGRRITNPHSFQVLTGQSTEEKPSDLKADYIYIGSKAVYSTDYKKEDLEKKPWKYRLVYLNDGAEVWKIL